MVAISTLTNRSRRIAHGEPASRGQALFRQRWGSPSGNPPAVGGSQAGMTAYGGSQGGMTAYGGSYSIPQGEIEKLNNENILLKLQLQKQLLKDAQKKALIDFQAYEREQANKPAQERMAMRLAGEAEDKVLRSAVNEDIGTRRLRRAQLALDQFTGAAHPTASYSPEGGVTFIDPTGGFKPGTPEYEKKRKELQDRVDILAGRMKPVQARTEPNFYQKEIFKNLLKGEKLPESRKAQIDIIKTRLKKINEILDTGMTDGFQVDLSPDRIKSLMTRRSELNNMLNQPGSGGAIQSATKQEPTGLPPSIQTASQAISYMMDEFGMDEEQARNSVISIMSGNYEGPIAKGRILNSNAG